MAMRVSAVAVVGHVELAEIVLQVVGWLLVENVDHLFSLLWVLHRLVRRFLVAVAALTLPVPVRFRLSMPSIMASRFSMLDGDFSSSMVAIAISVTAPATTPT